MRARFRIPSPPNLHPLVAYALAVVLPLAGLAIEHDLRAWIESIPFVLFFVIVSIVASSGGLGPGIVSVVLSALCGWSFLATSTHPADRARAIVGALVFAPAGLTIAVLGALARAGYREKETAARNLSDALRAREDFISIASHELKTPLTSLTLSVQRLSRPELHHASLDDPRVGHLMGLVGKHAARLNVLVSNLLDVSRIASGRLYVELQDVDVAEVVREVASRFADEFEHSGSALTLSLAGPTIGRWDRLRLEQVMTNLLSNAVKFGSGRPVRVSLAIDAGVAVLSVSDQGIGIDARDQRRIFERFERAARDAPFSGFGLGLWIVHEIVAALDGTVEVESARGRGSTFTVRLPLARPAVAAR